MRPGYCKSKAHKREHLGNAGRRVLVSRKWSGKTLGDHKQERKAWVLAQLEQPGISATTQDNDPRRHAWAAVNPSSPEVPALEHRILRAVAIRHEWRTQMELAQRRADGDLSAMGEAA